MLCPSVSIMEEIMEKNSPPVTNARDALPQGLTSEEVRRETEAGHVNIAKEKNGKSYFRIVTDNLCTFFNLVWAVIAVLMISLGSYTNLTFLFVIIPNVLIAIIQECRAKHTVEKLSVTTDPRATVIRDGELRTIRAEELVLGDVMKIEIGHQVLSDAVVISGLAEANESMLTGESDAIKKAEGDRVLAGSYLVSGCVFARVTAVGRDNYIHKIEKAAKSFKAPSSDLFRDLNRLLRYIAILMVIFVVPLYLTNLKSLPVAGSIQQTSGAVIGMIPAGIYLLVTVTLTLSVISLASKKTLVQDMYSIEMLARADVVCLDKTGTITDGTMCVSDLCPLGERSEEDLRRILANLEGAEESLNATARALTEAFGTAHDGKIEERIPFSSARKYSALSVSGLGHFSIGAPHFVRCPVSPELDAQIEAYAKEGKRVLLLAEHPSLREEGHPLALITVTDRIRPNARETIENFQEQGVTVKIISGDHAATVSSIAGRVGVHHSDRCISCENLTDEELEAAAEEHTVFGRVTPEQKVLLIKKLKSLGHTVAMTGDGVNDTLALKESNCAIAMAEGSEVARKVSQIVLLNSDFSTLPDVVREGRRCINNVRQSATLFLMKTLMTIGLTLFTIIASLFANPIYPFQPKGTVLLEFFVIGIASVLLALEPNNKRIEGSFLKSVILRSFPSAVALLLPLLTLSILHTAGVLPDKEIYQALSLLSVTLGGFTNLVAICIPYTKFRLLVVLSMGVGLAATIPLSILWLADMFSISCLASALPAALLVGGGSMLFAALVQTVCILFKRKIYAPGAPAQI